MDWCELYPATQQPQPEQVAAYVDSPWWEELLSYLQHSYNVAPQTEYSCCSAMPGWNVKFKKSGRSLCTLYPQAGGFYAMVVVGRREAEQAEFLLPHCSDYLQQLYQSSRPCNGARWLMIKVDADDILADVKRLIALRLPQSKQQ